ncbi:MAG: 4Fe-4S binding protein [Nitrospirae bacterium]|nr:4Fe-4S binding protein [Nitrospirota bacterium]
MSKPTNPPSSQEPIQAGRRQFLKQSVVSLGVTVHEFVKHRDAPREKKEEVGPAFRTDWLRPPGAVEESVFLERCTQCGDCLTVCPHDAICSHAEDETPVIFPDQAPCLLCDDFPCISACETEALLPVGHFREVAMGKAKVFHQICTASQGCNACVSRCPTQALAMDFSGFQLKVDATNCVGCGICEQVCLTVNDRLAIRVVPARSLP